MVRARRSAWKTLSGRLVTAWRSPAATAGSRAASTTRRGSVRMAVSSPDSVYGMTSWAPTAKTRTLRPPMREATGSGLCGSLPPRLSGASGVAGAVGGSGSGMPSLTSKKACSATC